MQHITETAIRTLPPLWLGMIVAISFIETPLKFKAPEITLVRGLGIGRIVFRVLNRVELGLAILIGIALAVTSMDVATGTCVALGVAAVALLAQIFALRPALDARTEQRIQGIELERSWHHVTYITLELAKLVGLLVAAIVIN